MGSSPVGLCFEMRVIPMADAALSARRERRDAKEDSDSGSGVGRGGRFIGVGTEVRDGKGL